MQLVVPAFRIKEALLEMHNGGSGDHFGNIMTFLKLRSDFTGVRRGRSIYCRGEDQRWRLHDSTRTEDENLDCTLRPPHEVQQ